MLMKAAPIFRDCILFRYTTGLTCLLTNSAAEHSCACLLMDVFSFGHIPGAEVLARRAYVYLAFPFLLFHCETQ